MTVLGLLLLLDLYGQQHNLIEKHTCFQSVDRLGHSISEKHLIDTNFDKFLSKYTPLVH